MSDLAKNLERVREAFRPAWSDERARAVAGRVLRPAPRKAALAARLGLALSAAALVTACLALFVATRQPERPPPVAAGRPGSRPAHRPATITFRDGSVASLRDETGVLRVRHDRPDHVEVELASGGATFDVVPRGARKFEVRIDEVRVVVLGTRFALERTGSGVRVAVDRGRVKVAWAGKERILEAGATASFPPTDAIASSSSEAAAAPPSERPVTGEGTRAIVSPKNGKPRATAKGQPRRAAPAWRSLAEDGDYDGAFAALERAGRTAVRDEPSDLLLAADVARLSRHPARAVEPLRTLLDRFPKDPRSPVAAFTLGRVLGDELGDHSGAAQAFAAAERLAPSGTLAEDALFRQAESFGKAGDGARASAAAGRYLARFPHGRHAAQVRRLAGLRSGR